jgi:hypothetical protein
VQASQFGDDDTGLSPLPPTICPGVCFLLVISIVHLGIKGDICTGLCLVRPLVVTFSHIMVRTDKLAACVTSVCRECLYKSSRCVHPTVQLKAPPMLTVQVEKSPELEGKHPGQESGGIVRGKRNRKAGWWHCSLCLGSDKGLERDFCLMTSAHSVLGSLLCSPFCPKGWGGQEPHFQLTSSQTLGEC